MNEAIKFAIAPFHDHRKNLQKHITSGEADDDLLKRPKPFSPGFDLLHKSASCTQKCLTKTARIITIVHAQLLKL